MNTKRTRGGLPRLQQLMLGVTAVSVLGMMGGAALLHDRASAPAHSPVDAMSTEDIAMLNSRGASVKSLLSIPTGDAPVAASAGYRCPVSASWSPCRMPSGPVRWGAEVCAVDVDMGAPFRTTAQATQPCLDEAVVNSIVSSTAAEYAPEDAMCGVDVGKDACECSTGEGERPFTVPCPRSMLVPCREACRAAVRRVQRHAARGRDAVPKVHTPPVELVEKVFRTFGTLAKGTAPLSPSAAANYSGPAFADVAQYYSGTGIVMWSGGKRLLTAFANALYVKRELKTHLPIQIWTHEGEGTPTAAMLELGHQHDIEFWMLSDKNGGYANFDWQRRWMRGDEQLLWKKPNPGVLRMMQDQRTNTHHNFDMLGAPSNWPEFARPKYVLPERYLAVALKPLPMLLSSFETVIFMDDDIAPLEDPVGLLRLLREYDPATGEAYRHSAVFWRDLWSLVRNAPMWDYFPFPGGAGNQGMGATYPTQESSISIVSKAVRGGEGFANLCLSSYMTFHHRTFYPAVYSGVSGQDAPGSGDKDMFHMAWLVRRQRYRMMGYPKLVGEKAHGCGHSLAQPDETGRTALLHFNGIKFTHSQYKEGLFDKLGMRYASEAYFQQPLPTGDVLAGLTDVERKQYKASGFDGINLKASGMAWEKPHVAQSMCLHFKKHDSAPMVYQWDVEVAYTGHMKGTFGSGWVEEFIEAVPTPAPVTPMTVEEWMKVGYKSWKASSYFAQSGATTVAVPNVYPKATSRRFATAVPSPPLRKRQ